MSNAVEKKNQKKTEQLNENVFFSNMYLINGINR